MSHLVVHRLQEVHERDWDPVCLCAFVGPTGFSHCLVFDPEHVISSFLTIQWHKQHQAEPQLVLNTPSPTDLVMLHHSTWNMTMCILSSHAGGDIWTKPKAKLDQLILHVALLKTNRRVSCCQGGHVLFFSFPFPLLCFIDFFENVKD